MLSSPAFEIHSFDSSFVLRDAIFMYLRVVDVIGFSRFTLWELVAHNYYFLFPSQQQTTQHESTTKSQARSRISSTSCSMQRGTRGRLWICSNLCGTEVEFDETIFHY
jgi:hypothetical protein